MFWAVSAGLLAVLTALDPSVDCAAMAAANDPTHNGVIAPGGTHTYLWQVPERAGPGPNDPSSLVWLYHSHNDEPRDTDAGLIGTIIITKKGMARPDGTPKDVDGECRLESQTAATCRW